MRLPTVGELVAIEPGGALKVGVVLVVLKRRELKRGSVLTLVGATTEFRLEQTTKPIQRLPKGWTVLDSVAAYERIGAKP